MTFINQSTLSINPDVLVFLFLITYFSIQPRFRIHLLKCASFVHSLDSLLVTVFLVTQWRLPLSFGLSIHLLDEITTDACKLDVCKFDHSNPQKYIFTLNFKNIHRSLFFVSVPKFCFLPIFHSASCPPHLSESGKGQITTTFLIQYQTFCHVLCPQTFQKTTTKGIFEFSLCELKIIVFSIWRKVLTNIVFFLI